jgi:RNA 2',3'-cyclic 3'-phosphodiesterase
MDRLFIAVEIADAVRQRLGAALKAVPTAGVQLKWVRPENMHLTLAFLGDTAPDVAEAVKGLMDQAGGGTAPFEFDVAGIGYFGNRREPRVVWAGLSGDLVPLKKLQTRLSNGLKSLGLTIEERDFKPHLTLARIKAVIHAGAFVHALERQQAEVCGRTRVDRLVLMRSELSPEGPAYTPVHTAPLGIGKETDHDNQA